MNSYDEFLSAFNKISQSVNEEANKRSEAWKQGFRDYEQNGQYNENKFKTESERMDYDSGFNYAKSLRDEEAGGEDVMETQMKGDGEGAFVTKSPEEVAKIKVEKMYGKKKDKEVKEADENQTPELRNDVEEEEEKAQLGSIVSEPSFFGGMSESMDSFDQIAEAVGKQRSVPDMHQLRVLKQTLQMPDQMVGVMGGPSKEESREILKSKFGYSDAQIAKLEESVNEEAKSGMRVQYHDGGIKKSATVKSVWKSATGVDFATLKTAEGEKDVPLDKLKEAIVKVKESYDGAADELKLYIDNTRNLYDSLSGEFSQNLYRKMKKGVYDKNLAVKLMMYLVDRAAKQYMSEFDAAGARMQDTFPKQSREKVAVALVQDWEEAYKTGEWGMEAPKANESKNDWAVVNAGSEKQPLFRAVPGDVMGALARKPSKEEAEAVADKWNADWKKNPAYPGEGVKKVGESVSEAGMKIGEVQALIDKNNSEHGTTFYLGGAYGNQELWAKDVEGHGHRLEAGSTKDVYNAFVKYRFSEKYRKANESVNEAAGQPLSVFNVDSAEATCEKLRTGISAPFVNVYPSTLGGPEHVSIMMRVSLQPKEQWSYGIFHNSPFLMFMFENNGELTNDTNNYQIKKRMRKTNVKNVDDAINKINAHIASLGQVANEGKAPEVDSEDVDIVKALLEAAQGTEKDIQGILSTAIDGLYSAMNPESKFTTPEGRKLRDGVYRCIRALEQWHDALHGLKVSEGKVNEELDRVMKMQGKKVGITKVLSNSDAESRGIKAGRFVLIDPVENDYMIGGTENKIMSFGSHKEATDYSKKMGMIPMSESTEEKWSEMYQRGYDNAAVRFAYIPDFKTPEEKKDFELGMKDGYAKVNSAKNSSESVISEEYDPHIIQGSIYAMKNQKDLTPEEIKTQFPEVDVERFLIGQSNARAVVKGHKGVNVVVDGKRVNDVPFPSSTAAMSWAQANLPDKNYEFEKIGESKIDEAIASQALISELKVILQSLEKEDKEFALDRLRKLVTAAIRDGIA
jgi:hypothetical protein